MTGVPLNIDWQQILLHLLNFAILFFVLYLVLYKPVKNFMDKRKAGYEEMDEKAKTNLAESEKVKAEYEAKLAEAESEAEGIKHKAYQEAAAIAKETTDEAHEQAPLELRQGGWRCAAGSHCQYAGSRLGVCTLRLQQDKAEGNTAEGIRLYGHIVLITVLLTQYILSNYKNILR